MQLIFNAQEAIARDQALQSATTQTPLPASA